MLMSVCLQSIVDELLNQKDGNEFNNIQVGVAQKHSIDNGLSIVKTNGFLMIFQAPQPRNIILSYVRRDGKLYPQNNRSISISSSSETVSSMVCSIHILRPLSSTCLFPSI